MVWPAVYILTEKNGKRGAIKQELARKSLPSVQISTH